MLGSVGRRGDMGGREYVTGKFYVCVVGLFVIFYYAAETAYVYLIREFPEGVPSEVHSWGAVRRFAE
jgi:hypothetical protein